MCADRHEMSGMVSSVAPDHFLSTDLVETLDATQLLAVISIKFRIE